MNSPLAFTVNPFREVVNSRSSNTWFVSVMSTSTTARSMNQSALDAGLEVPGW